MGGSFTEQPKPKVVQSEPKIAPKKELEQKPVSTMTSPKNAQQRYSELAEQNPTLTKLTKLFELNPE